VGLGDSVFIGREPEIGLECTWYDLSGQVIGQGAGIWVTPTHISTYIVAQNLCGDITQDTVTIWALGTDIDIAEKEQVRISPNPATQTCTIYSTIPCHSTLTLTDIQGRIIQQIANCPLENEYTWDITSLPQCIYFVQLFNLTSHETYMQKLIVE
jgi:hypothetical protein